MDKEYSMLEAKQLKQQGKKQYEIAEELGVTDRTIRNWLKRPSEPPQRAPRKSKLDPYKTHINSIIEVDPLHNCEILFDSLINMGYTGKISILRDYVVKVRAKVIVKAVRRFETEPGFQAQVDWGEFRRTLPDGTKEKVYAFVMTMGYSRKSFIIFTKSMNQSVLLACHMLAFIYFGGVPKEILYDNMRTAFLRDEDGRWKPHKKLLAFANHYGFVPRRCQVRRPQTKGKVERAVGYLKQNFWPRVKDTVWELNELNEAVMAWLVKVDQKILRDFQQTRSERYDHEKQFLQTLPGQDYDYRLVKPVLVNRESYITYETNRYSVPPVYLGEELTLKIDFMKNLGEICIGEKKIRHIELLKPGRRGKVTDPQDYDELHKLWDKQRQEKIPTKKIKERDKDTDTRSPADYEQLINTPGVA